MKEIEVKAKVSNFEEVKSKLSDPGCVFSEPQIQKDRVYLPEGVKFPDKTKGTLFLRIRNSNGKHILTLKKQIGTEHENIEHELVIDSPEEADEMAKMLGFYEVLCVSKKRIKCKYADMEICLDEVDELGSFVEVEKMTNEDDTQKVTKELFEFLKTLGISEEDRIDRGYATLIDELHNQNNK